MKQLETDRLARALRELAVSFVRAGSTAGLSRTAAATLGRLERDGDHRITDLATDEGITQPAMTGLVQRLEQAGHVTRRADPADGRASLISITPTGLDALRTRRAEQDAVVAARLEHLSPEQRARLSDALEAIETLTHTPADHLEDHALA
ncbi:hypothetical protein ASD11_07820 [Aeromicrobium sp. Root495]|uniref:MarR family winged helix-turn-helix transcriptional regulator n=1 Tax=Aeromicrobium sp. Root495 TaxID=1736550 RepID=UPI0006F43209|nr:MarR family transcriptional regulator [Aeromicrobium sp. Root495]KQY59461.1 hypothetical protein ASD11_07820 [Aeromicrobium sp. Root495]